MAALPGYPLKDGGPVRIGLWWLVGLFLIALAIRCIGLLWGGIDADENIADPAKVLTGRLIPTAHYYPPLLNYLTAAGYLVLYAIGIPMRLWRSTAEFRAAFFDNPTPFLLVLRLVVSVTGAVAAPLSAAIAARLGLSRRGCLLVGVASALLPISVWRSHIGKQDLGVAVSALLAVWAMVRYAQELRRVPVVWFGVAVALAVSFKQSALFVVAPLGIALLLLARRTGQSWPRLAQDTLIAVAVGIVVWVPLNVGLWLDWSNFLDYQKVLAAMHIKEGGVRETFEAVWPRLTDRFSGPTLPLFVGFLVSPLFWRRHDIFLIWASILVSVIVSAAISGTRADVQLYVPEAVLIGTIGIMTWIWMAGRKDWSRWPGMVGLVSSFVVLVAGSLAVDRQALATPINSRVAEALRKVDGIGRRRILATDVPLTGLPLAGSADRDVRERDERLAQKYGVTLPPRSRPYPPDEGRYYIRPMPWAIGGFENFDEKDAKLIKPFAWPLQPEEWRLHYWLNKGFTVFVIRDEEAWLSPPDQPCSSGSPSLADCYSRVDAYRELHEEIHSRCTVVASIPADRPLFEEQDTKVYLSDPL
jgi:Dolichyl-phosphate-mannose-protein mannosyltransferase